MSKNSESFHVFFLAILLSSSLALSGCAAALIAGGAAGGYAIAKDMEDGKLIDSR